MTVPADAYVSFTAREAARQIIGTPDDNPQGMIVCGRTHGFFVLVARGPVADELEKALDPATKRVEPELCRECITPRPAAQGGLCARHAATRASEDDA